MKALVVYSDASGRKDFSPHVGFVKKELVTSFEALDFKHISSEEEADSVYAEAAARYGAIIVCGGDGSFNRAVNVIMGQPQKPILGYINFGTIGDVGKNFGVRRNMKKALGIIKSQHREKIDIGEAISQHSKQYFVYCAAFGAYSDIAYKASRSEKKKAGRLAYYAKAICEAFKAEKHLYTYGSDSLKKIGTAPFLLVLNGKNIGGFLVNRKGDIQDGKMEVFLTKKTVFNGLLRYFPVPAKPDDVCEKCEFTNLENLPWCLDGEKGPSGDVSLIIRPSALEVFSQKLS